MLIKDKNTSSPSKQYFNEIRQKRLVLMVLVCLLFLVAIVSLLLGSINFSLSDLFKILSKQADPTTQMIFYNIRLPRVVTAIVVGAMLAMSGLIMQCVMANPLASPSTLGVAQGAAFGAAIGIIIFGGGVLSITSSPIAIDNPYIVTLSAFFFSILTTIIILLISRFSIYIEASGLVLVGIALSAVFSAGSMLLQYFADDVQLGAVVFWTYGNVGGTSWQEILILAIVFFLAFIFFKIHQWDYFALEAGTEIAKSVGVNTRTLTLLGMTICSLVTAIAVSFVGVISFIGLISPHLMRRFIGNSYNYLIPATAIGGSIILLFSDTVGRLVMAPTILPVGAITSLLGGPMFIFILVKRIRQND